MFFPKLAWNNIRKNKIEYFPFVLSVVVTVVLNLVVQMILTNPKMAKLPGASATMMLLGFGAVIIGLFTVVFITYTHSFLIARRNREFGLYNILGMSKKDIIKLLFIENFFVYFISMVLGVLSGIVFSKGMFLVLIKLLEEQVFPFKISFLAIGGVCLLFAGIFIWLSIYDTISVLRAKSIHLLQSESTGEKEPKSRWIVTVLGLITLVVGYGISLTVETPLTALARFFIAVLFVIIATYALFIGGSITFLKIMKKKKSYYYQSKHFVTVSGMLFRMKQNAVGLANIAILTTMTLVSLVTTVGLYVGTNDIVHDLSPLEYSVNASNMTRKDLETKVKPILKEKQVKIKKLISFETTTDAMAFLKKGNEMVTVQKEGGKMAEMSSFRLMTVGEYNHATGETLKMKKNELYVYDYLGKYDKDTLKLGTTTYQVKLLKTVMTGLGNGNSILHQYLIIAKDNTVVQEIANQYTGFSGDKMLNQPISTMYFDLAGKVKKETNEELKKLIPEIDPNGGVRINVTEELTKEFQGFSGGFLFIGLIFGFSFILATALIIYYKQVSEGQADKRRFEILQKVGMSHEEVKRTIKSQVIWVFFLPIIVAIIHLAVALPMIIKMLGLFNIRNTPLILATAGGTVFVIALLYYVIYQQTSKIYYKLVER
jgi:putative ABC transport system permease protein